MTSDLLTDELALLGLANRYATAVDRRDADGLAALFTVDGGLDRPGASWRGHEQLRGIVARLDAFDMLPAIVTLLRVVTLGA